MSEHLKNSMLKLNEVFKTDTALQAIYESMVSFLVLEESQQKEAQQNQLIHEARLKEQLLTYSLRYLNYKNNLKRANKGIEIKLNLNTQKIRETLRQTSKQEQLNSQKEIEILEQKIKELKNEFDAQKSQIDALLSKEKIALLKTMAEIKRHHQEEVLEKESKYTLELNQITQTYDKKHLILTQKKDKTILTYDQTLEENKVKRDLESKVHDEDYIDIKLHFSMLNKALNEAIFSFQKQRASILDQVETNHQNKVKPILKEMNDTDTNTEDKISILESDYQQTKALLLKKKADMFESYESQKNKLVQQMSGSISNLNSKLSNFKETIQTQKSDIQKQYFTHLKEGKTVNLAKRNAELADLDQELNRQILLTKRDVNIKKNQGYQAIFKHEQQYIKDNASLDHELKLLKHTFDYDVKHLELVASLHKKHLQDKIRRHELDKKFIIDQLQMMHDHEIKKLQIQIDMASHTQERDLSQLTQDALIDVSYLDIQITEDALKHQLDLIDFDYKKSLFDLQKQHDLRQLELEHNRQLELLSMTRDHELSTLESRIVLAEKLHERNLNELKVQYEIHYFELTKKIQLIEQLLNHQLKSIELKSSLSQSRFEMYASRHKIKSDHLLKKEYFLRQKNITHYYFESFVSISRTLLSTQFNELKWYQFIRQTLQKLYQVPAHPETLSVYFDFILESLSQSQSQRKNIDQFKLQFESLYHTLAHDFYDNLKLYRIIDLKQAKFHVEQKYELEKKAIKDKLDLIEIELKQLNKQHHLDQEKQSLKMSQLDQHYNSLLKEMAVIDKQLLMEEKSYDQGVNALEQSYQTSFQKALKDVNQAMLYFEKTHQIHHHFIKSLVNHYQKLKNSRYLSESLLNTSMNSIYKLEESYHHQLVTVMESLYTTVQAFKEKFSSALFQESNLKSKFFQLEIKKVQDHYAMMVQKSEDQLKDVLKQKALFTEHIHTEIKKTTSSLQQKHDQLFEKLSSDIKSLELSVQQAASVLSTSMDYHQLNTKDLLSSLNKEFDKQTVLLDESVNKKLIKMNEKIVLEKKNHSMMVVTTENKIQSMLIKHHTYMQKIHEQVKNERINFGLNLSKYQKLHKQKLKASKLRTSKLLKQMSEEKKTLEHQMSLVERRHTKRHQSIVMKRQQELSKSYRFKLKMLHID